MWVGGVVGLWVFGSLGLYQLITDYRLLTDHRLMPCTEATISYNGWFR